MKKAKEHPNMFQHCSNMAPKIDTIWGHVKLQNRLGRAKERTKNATEDDTEKHQKHTQHKPVNAWNGKRVQVETNVSIFCKCPKGIAEYCCTTEKSTKNHPKINPTSSQHHPNIIPKSSPNQPTIIPKSFQNRPFL